MITVDKLSYGQRLADISLTVQPGETLALVGSQGSGKTTLLRILAGQLRPDHGSARVGGVPSLELDARRLLGVAGTAWGFYPRLSACENLGLTARLWALPEARVYEALKALDLLERMHVRVERLTPGEVARLGLALALLHDPPALLLDEPIGDVDRESASILSFAIGEAAERGKAVLIASFGHAGTLALAHRLAYLEGGRLLHPAAPAEPSPAPTAAAGLATPPPSSEASGPPARHVAARAGERILLFAPDDIKYAYAQEKAVFIQTALGPCAVNVSLTELEERLVDQGFFRCHRGFLVNLDCVKEIVSWTRDSYSLLLKDGKDVPLSKHRAQELKMRLKW